MYVAGTLDTDEELIQNVASVMQGARVAACGAGDAEGPALKTSLSLRGRQPNPDDEAPP